MGLTKKINVNLWEYFDEGSIIILVYKDGTIIETGNDFGEEVGPYIYNSLDEWREYSDYSYGSTKYFGSYGKIPEQFISLKASNEYTLNRIKENGYSNIEDIFLAIELWTK